MKQEALPCPLSRKMESFEGSGPRKILQVNFLCKESAAEDLNFVDKPH